MLFGGMNLVQNAKGEWENPDAASYQSSMATNLANASAQGFVNVNKQGQGVDPFQFNWSPAGQTKPIFDQQPQSQPMPQSNPYAYGSLEFAQFQDQQAQRDYKPVGTFDYTQQPEQPLELTGAPTTADPFSYWSGSNPANQVVTDPLNTTPAQRMGLVQDAYGYWNNPNAVQNQIALEATIPGTLPNDTVWMPPEVSDNVDYTGWSTQDIANHKAQMQAVDADKSTLQQSPQYQSNVEFQTNELVNNIAASPLASQMDALDPAWRTKSYDQISDLSLQASGQPFAPATQTTPDREAYYAQQANDPKWANELKRRTGEDLSAIRAARAGTWMEGLSDQALTMMSLGAKSGDQSWTGGLSGNDMQLINDNWINNRTTTPTFTPQDRQEYASWAASVEANPNPTDEDLSMFKQVMGGTTDLTPQGLLANFERLFNERTNVRTGSPSVVINAAKATAAAIPVLASYLKSDVQLNPNQLTQVLDSLVQGSAYNNRSKAIQDFGNVFGFDLYDAMNDAGYNQGMIFGPGVPMSTNAKVQAGYQAGLSQLADYLNNTENRKKLNTGALQQYLGGLGSGYQTNYNLYSSGLAKMHNNLKNQAELFRQLSNPIG